MEKIPVPFAVSAITRPDKIRALIYANNRIAHASLAQILKAAMPDGETEAGHYIRLSDAVTLFSLVTRISLTAAAMRLLPCRLLLSTPCFACLLSHAGSPMRTLA